ncbi:MAG: trehalose-6-phosphate synthase [Sandaracinaceae bacterium]
MPRKRLIVASNRGPFRRSRAGSGRRVVRAAGGLVAALDPVLRERGGVWVSAQETDSPQVVRVAEEELSYELAQVPIPRRTQNAFYAGFANGVLWPLLHSMPPTIQLGTAPYDAYAEVNRLFADACLATGNGADAQFWVHDYQLLLVPAMIREQAQRARLGFFCHIPWPGPDLFATLPWREAILDGVLGADVVGFHTDAYAEQFLACVARLRDHPVDHPRRTVKVGPRTVRVLVDPIGVPWSDIQTLALDPRVAAQVKRIRAAKGGRKLVLGVDRLDSTKGIPERLRAFEQLLTTDRSMANRVLFVQVMVPSRTAVEAYRDLKDEVDRFVGDLNGRFSITGRLPLHYYFRNLPPHELYGHYRAADVAFVTPLRDGMNLVAQEYVASRVDHDGVLILSEFAGSAQYLTDALLVNPYDVDRTTEALRYALRMPADEERARMRSLRTAVKKLDVHLWADAFLEHLERWR